MIRERAPNSSELRIRSASGGDLAWWDAVVRSFPNHRVTHLRAWLESLEDAGCGTPLFLLAERGDTVLACIPGLLVRVGPWQLFGSPMAGWQTKSLGPCFDPVLVSTAELFEALVPYLEREHGVRHIELLHDSLDERAMRELGFQEEVVPTYRAPLDPASPQKTFAAMKESARRNVRRGEKLGIEVRLGLEEGFIAEHYDQIREVYRRGGNQVTFTEARLAAGIRRLEASGNLVAASAYLPGSDVRIATGTFFIEGKELSLWHWAHREHYRWWRATELMTWRVMERAMAAGCETFDFMGRGEFKTKFGATLDTTKRRWLHTTAPVLAAARPVAKAFYEAKKVVAGRVARVVARGFERASNFVHSSRAPRPHPAPVVLGDIDLVRALGLGGIDCVVHAPPGDAARYSRHTVEALEWRDPWLAPGRVLDTLLMHAATQGEPPALFYEDDASLLLVSRHRDRLARAYRFVLPDAELIEQLVDKARFQSLARQADLPVPRGVVLDTAGSPPPADLDLQWPVVVKPLTRRPLSWDPLGGGAKALRVASPEELAWYWPRLASADLTVLAQECVPGDETAIESYHVYVDAQGKRITDFTGRKLRTHPLRFGDSSALEITDTADVSDLGRKLTTRLKLRGVAKFDFKRRPDGSLALLEINPRFTLWHHPAACAGLNIPALVHGDLMGIQRLTAIPVARAGVHWCKPWTDHASARELGMSLVDWTRWALRCEAKRAFAWDDPMPLLRSALHRSRLARRTRPSPVSDPVESHA